MPFHSITIFSLAHLLPLSLAHLPQQKTPFKLAILYNNSIADAHPSFLLEEAILLYIAVSKWTTPVPGRCVTKCLLVAWKFPWPCIGLLLYEFHEKKPSWKFCPSKSTYMLSLSFLHMIYWENYILLVILRQHRIQYEIETPASSHEILLYCVFI